MAFVLIVGLIVAVVALSLELSRQQKTIDKYEKELIKKAKKGKK